MSVLVDSSVMIDFLRNDVVNQPASIHVMRELCQTTTLYINQVVAAEIRWVSDIPHPLLGSVVERLDLSWEAAALAGEAHARYRSRGGPRDAILADFLIGAHAAAANLALLTRNPRRVRTAFASVRLIVPELPEDTP